MACLTILEGFLLIVALGAPQNAAAQVLTKGESTSSIFGAEAARPPPLAQIPFPGGAVELRQDVLAGAKKNVANERDKHIGVLQRSQPQGGWEKMENYKHAVHSNNSTSHEFTFGCSFGSTVNNASLVQELGNWAVKMGADATGCSCSWSDIQSHAGAPFDFSKCDAGFAAQGRRGLTCFSYSGQYSPY